MTTRILIQIGGMQCPNCSMILERIEDRLAGVTLAEASYHKQQMLVEYNESQVSQAQIETEVRRMGYEVKGVLAGKA